MGGEVGGDLGTVDPKGWGYEGPPLDEEDPIPFLPTVEEPKTTEEDDGLWKRGK